MLISPARLRIKLLTRTEQIFSLRQLVGRVIKAALISWGIAAGLFFFSEVGPATGGFHTVLMVLTWGAVLVGVILLAVAVFLTASFGSSFYDNWDEHEFTAVYQQLAETNLRDRVAGVIAGITTIPVDEIVGVNLKVADAIVKYNRQLPPPVFYFGNHLAQVMFPITETEDGYYEIGVKVEYDNAH